jgi:hypothetical protein
MHEENGILKVGDMAEFQRTGNPQPEPEWHPEIVAEIRVVEDYDDKEGVSVSEMSWRAIRDYEHLVIVIGKETWARNDQVRRH